MNVKLILCEGADPTGNPCGQIAAVVESRQVVETLADGRTAPATEYLIDCPACGRRTRVIVAPDDGGLGAATQ